jgi:hypothetical protein
MKKTTPAGTSMLTGRWVLRTFATDHMSVWEIRNEQQGPTSRAESHGNQSQDALECPDNQHWVEEHIDRKSVRNSLECSVSEC